MVKKITKIKVYKKEGKGKKIFKQRLWYPPNPQPSNLWVYLAALNKDNKELVETVNSFYDLTGESRKDTFDDEMKSAREFLQQACKSERRRELKYLNSKKKEYPELSDLSLDNLSDEQLTMWITQIEGSGDKKEALKMIQKEIDRLKANIEGQRDFFIKSPTQDINQNIREVIDLAQGNSRLYRNKTTLYKVITEKLEEKIPQSILQGKEGMEFFVSFTVLTKTIIDFNGINLNVSEENIEQQIDNIPSIQNLFKTFELMEKSDDNINAILKILKEANILINLKVKETKKIDKKKSVLVSPKNEIQQNKKYIYDTFRKISPEMELQITGNATRGKGAEYIDALSDFVTNGIQYSFGVGGKNLPTDTLKLVFTGEVQPSQKCLNEIMQAQKRLNRKLTSKRVELERREKTYEDFYREVQTILDKNNEGEKKAQLFIKHDSVKDYVRIGVPFANQLDVFKGGDSYTIPQLEVFLKSLTNLGFSTMDISFLRGCLINTGRETIMGLKNKEPLEDYLSNYVGLLLFDDYQQIVRNMTDKLTNLNDNLEVLHIFRLNSAVYVPVSVILNKLKIAMEQQEKNVAQGIKAQISPLTGAVNFLTKKVKEGMSSENRWKALSDYAVQRVKIKIVFLAGFLDFLKSLLET